MKDLPLYDAFMSYSTKTGTNCDALVLTFVRSELLKVGCDLEAHFPSVLDRIGKDEINTSQCMILAITTARYIVFSSFARNPFISDIENSTGKIAT